MTDLDAIDIKILELLQHDAARSIAEIAEQIHLSHNACWRRIRQLEESGIIKKNTAARYKSRMQARLKALAPA